jgi:hypothetical protein
MLFVVGQLSTYPKSIHLTWHGYDYGVSLALLPMLLLIGLLAPLVSYRRRDALLHAGTHLEPGRRLAYRFQACTDVPP